MDLNLDSDRNAYLFIEFEVMSGLSWCRIMGLVQKEGVVLLLPSFSYLTSLYDVRF